MYVCHILLADWITADLRNNIGFLEHRISELSSVASAARESESSIAGVVGVVLWCLSCPDTTEALQSELRITRIRVDAAAAEKNEECEGTKARGKVFDWIINVVSSSGTAS